MKLGYKLLFVLKHLDIVTKKKKLYIYLFLSYLHRKYQIQDWHKKNINLKLISLINFHRDQEILNMKPLTLKNAFLKAVLDKFLH